MDRCPERIRTLSDERHEIAHIDFARLSISGDILTRFDIKFADAEGRVPSGDESERIQESPGAASDYHVRVGASVMSYACSILLASAATSLNLQPPARGRSKSLSLVSLAKMRGRAVNIRAICAMN